MATDKRRSIIDDQIRQNFFKQQEKLDRKNKATIHTEMLDLFLHFSKEKDILIIMDLLINEKKGACRRLDEISELISNPTRVNKVVDGQEQRRELLLKMAAHIENRRLSMSPDSDAHSNLDYEYAIPVITGPAKRIPLIPSNDGLHPTQRPLPDTNTAPTPKARAGSLQPHYGLQNKEANPLPPLPPSQFPESETGVYDSLLLSKSYMSMRPQEQQDPYAAADNTTVNTEYSYKLLYEECKQKLREAQNKEASNKRHVERMQKANDELKKELAEKNRNIDSLTRQNNSRANSANTKIQEMERRCANAEANLLQKQKDLDSTRERFEAQICSLTEQLGEQRATRQAVKEDQEARIAIQKKLSDQEKEIRSQEEKIKILQNDLQDERHEFQFNLQKKQEELDKIKIQLTEQENEIIALRIQENGLKEDFKRERKEKEDYFAQLSHVLSNLNSRKI